MELNVRVEGYWGGPNGSSASKTGSGGQQVNEFYGCRSLTSRLAMLVVNRGGPEAEKVLRWIVYGEYTGFIGTLPDGMKVDFVHVKYGDFPPL